MGFRFDEESQNSVNAGPAGDEELLDDEGSEAGAARGATLDVVGGPPAPPEALLGRWPTDPEPDPDAASLLVEDYLQRRRRGENSLGDYQERFPASPGARGLLAMETFCQLDGRQERQSRGPRSDCPTWATRSSGSASAAPGQGGVRPGLPGRPGRPRRPAGRPEGLGDRGERAADPRPAPAHQHRPDLFGPRGAEHRASGRSACPTSAGRASRRSCRGSGPIRRARPPATSSSARWRRSSRRGPARSGSGTEAEERVRPERATALPEPAPRAGADRAAPLAGLRAMSYEHATAWVVAQLAEGL